MGGPLERLQNAREFRDIMFFERVNKYSSRHVGARILSFS
jgi:hypothetical protein